MSAANWTEQNQRWLAERFVELRARIEQRASRQKSSQNGGTWDAGPLGDEPSTPPNATDDGFVSALERCAALFGLTPFEANVLLLCAGVALDGALARAVNAAAGAPTFAFAMSLLGEAHWDAIAPQAPLRAWRLICVDGAPIPEAPLRIDERMMHFLAGVSAFDERLEGHAELVMVPPGSAPIPGWATQLVAALAGSDGIVQLNQPGARVSREQLLQVLAAVGRPAVWITHLPDDGPQLPLTLRLLAREAALTSALVVLDLRDAPESTHAPLLARARGLVSLSTPLLVVGAPEIAASDEHVHRFWLPTPTPELQADELVLRALRYGSPLPPDTLRRAIANGCEQFVLNQSHASDVAARAIADAGSDVTLVAERCWAALRAGSRGGLDQLAQRIDSETRFEHVVLPPAQRTQLRELARQLQHRRRVYRDWGFATRSSRGLGLTALFCGESGTGKTMAAEAIANEARLDLYRIDLANTVNKYIGETEKNLKRIFDAAEVSGAVLLFDEADALFGKRSDVKDSHDRYANLEIAYLLQRIEAYRGLAILTTNLRSSLDKAFLRRLRFVVQFPFPDDGARNELWRQQFPPQAPLEADIRWDLLASLHLTGGHIRSVALNAAFAAAHDGGAISQAHLMAAAQVELVKLERVPALPGGRA